MSYTAVALLIDRSGSMGSIRLATQDAINEFVRGQVAESVGSKRTIRISVFDDRFEVFTPSVHPAAVPTFELYPRGLTALHDAMVTDITSFGAELAAMPSDERPDNVLYAVMTDGLENASRTASADDVKKLVTQQEQVYSWQFAYLGANQDAVLTAQGLGINRDSAITYAATDHGTRSVIDTMDCYVTQVASGLQVNTSSSQRKDAVKK